MSNTSSVGTDVLLVPFILNFHNMLLSTATSSRSYFLRKISNQPKSEPASRIGQETFTHMSDSQTSTTKFLTACTGPTHTTNLRIKSVTSHTAYSLILTVFKQLFGVNMTNADIIAAADESNNSYLTQLDKAQFCIAMHSIIKNLKEMECRSSVLHRLSEEHFDLLDCEKKGFITYPDLQRAAKTAGCQTTSDTLMQMFDMITRDDAQRITRDEFLDFF
ncbi:MAG: hypothetical protein MHMPM18_001089 [Marteilia pararefringens]